MTTATVAGIESEAPLGYAALDRLIRFFPGAVDRLPAPQRDALRTALGLDFGPLPDRFLIGLGVLTLLADAAADGPLLVVIDDGQWLDPESCTVLGFAARRLQAERVVMLFAARETEDGPPLSSALPELAIDPLDDRAATELLAEITGGLLGPDIRARLLGECRGNPLALVEVARELTPEQLTGAAVLPDPLPAVGSLSELFARRLRQLAPGARLLLAVAAAEPTVSKPLAWDVVQRLGAAAEADDELGRLVSFGADVRFSHPLVRSAAYYSRPLAERRRIHGALAEVMDSPPNSDRAAWHLAMATTGPDEAVASRLEQAARRMRDRGGYAANSALLQRAAALSVDEHVGTGRLLADFIEAAARSGQDAEAVTALAHLAARATAGDGRLGHGRLARCRALLAPGDEAEEQYRRSIELLGDANSATELARSYLVYGEWLRRQRRAREARGPLGAAFAAFADMGARGFAARAQAELEATGVHAKTRHADASSGLTAQETQVARLVAAGDTNREVAAKLFISPATVDYHLRHIYQKHGVSSRTLLARKIS
jgi:DNA-binding CsgD family transcriptional regulator